MRGRPSEAAVWFDCRHPQARHRGATPPRKSRREARAAQPLNRAFLQLHVEGQATNLVGQHIEAGRRAGLQVPLEFGEFGTDFDSGIYEGGGDPV
ncbi:MAG: hypothetical protein AAGD07_23650, partial [Planctomycetota bacterium]